MFIKRKIKKICKNFEVPDISHRIPALADSNEVRKERKTITYRRVAICAGLAIVLIATFVISAFYNGNNGGEDHGNTIVVDNITSKTEGNEGKENETTDDWKDHVIQNNSSKENDLSSYKILYGTGNSIDRIEEIICVGDFEIYDFELESALNDTKSEENLYAVETIIGAVYYEDKNRNIEELRSKHKALLHMNASIHDFYDRIVYIIDNNVEIIIENDDKIGFNSLSGLSAQVNEIKTKFEEVEELGGFNEKYYDKETVDVLYKLANSSEKDLASVDYLTDLVILLKPLLTVTEEVQISGSGFSSLTVIELKRMRAYNEEMQWVCDSVVAYFKEHCGVELTPLKSDEAISRGYSVYECYTAILTKEQIYSLKNERYGVFVAFQGNSSAFDE